MCPIWALAHRLLVARVSPVQSTRRRPTATEPSDYLKRKAAEAEMDQLLRTAATTRVVLAVVTMLVAAPSLYAQVELAPQSCTASVRSDRSDVSVTIRFENQ